MYQERKEPSVAQKFSNLTAASTGKIVNAMWKTKELTSSDSCAPQPHAGYLPWLLLSESFENYFSEIVVKFLGAQGVWTKGW